MRIIFDVDDSEDRQYLEIQLSENEIKALHDYEPVEKEVYNELGSKSMLNVYIRRLHHAIEKG